MKLLTRFKANVKAMAYQWILPFIGVSVFIAGLIVTGIIYDDPTAYSTAFVVVGLFVGAFMTHMLFNKTT